VQVFLQSAFLQALTRSLIASVWQMFFLWFACIVIFKFLKLTSRQKFNIALTAQFSGLALFMYTFAALYGDTTQSGIYALPENFLPVVNSFITVCMPYMAIAYLMVLVFKLTKFIFVYNESKAIKRSELKKIAADKRIFVEQMSALLSLHRKVKIYLSEKINCPLTIGFLKPVILIPVAAVNHLTTEQLEAVILHELAHIKRADYILFILQSIVDKIFFFNIFSLMLSNIIERERENACDDWVLQFRYNSMHYAEALFKLGRLKALPVFAMPFPGKKENLLLTRVRRLLHKPQHKTYDMLPVFSSGIFSLFVAASVLAFSYGKPAGQKAAQTVQKVIVAQPTYVQPVAENKPIQKASNSFNKIADELVKEKATAEKRVNVQNRVTDEVTARSKAIYNDELQTAYNAVAQQKNYLSQVKVKLDSLKTILPSINEAVNKQFVVTPDVIQKVISYQTFRRLESMLAASGNNIKITEADSSKDSYRKHITIESTDKNGNRHVYVVIAQMYQ
jgi:beta-lactamase regulating signal transducer with metallopeptidase domain